MFSVLYRNGEPGKSGRSRKRRANFRPAVQALEDRTLPTAGTALNPAAVLAPALMGSHAGALVAPVSPAVTHFGVSTSANPATAGTPLTLTLTALDATGALVPGYAGTVHFTSSDAAASLPANYIFTAADNGVHTFPLTFGTAGSQTVTVTDTAAASVNGSAAVSVNNPLPALTGLGSVSVAEGSPSLTLTVTGSNFVARSVVQWNGAALATTFMSATQLQAAVPASALAEEGAFAVTVVNTSPGGGASAAQTFTVLEAPLAVTALAVSASEGTAFNGPVATFTDAGGAETPANYKALIDWGDGSPATAGTVTLVSGNTLQVNGSHTYAEEGWFPVKVTVQDDGATVTPGAKASAGSTAAVADAPLFLTANKFSVAEGAAFAGPVATFTDAGGAETPANYQVRIDWGDGTAPTPGTVTLLPGNTFQVSGSHTYAEEGSFAVKVAVQDDGTTATPNTVGLDTGKATVTDAALRANGTALGTAEGAPLTGTVATFTDADPAAAAGDYTASVVWGDGTPADTSATVTANPGGGFRVTGKHAYAGVGSYAVTVLIRDQGGSSVSVVGIAHITDLPLRATGTAVTVPRGVAAANVRLATFTDTAGLGPVGNYTATINWGDGTPAGSGVISVSGGTGVVLGSHTFATPGRFAIQVTVRDRGGSSVGAISSGVVGSPDERFVAQVFRDLLHRPVDAASLANWTGMLARGIDRSQVVLAIEQGPEYRTVLIQGWYQALLHRTADPAGLAGTLLFLQAGGTDEQAEAGLLGSAEYYLTNGGGTNTGFVTALYRDILGQAIDPAAQTFFTTELAGGVARATVALQVLTSGTAERKLVQSDYQQFLHRAGDSAGISHYVTFLGQGGRDEQIIAQLVGSAEYAAPL
jgi:hypothetical protein